jgi:hypothetical protein
LLALESANKFFKHDADGRINPSVSKKEMQVIKIIIAGLVADGGLFVFDPQWGAMGAVVLILSLFVASVFTSTR